VQIPVPDSRERIEVVTEGDVDPRFSLANERTFLAWIRTALGLLASAAGVLAVDVPGPTAVVRGIALLLAAAGGLAAVLGSHRWRRVQRSIEAGETYPAPRAHLVLAATVLVVSVAIVLITLT
jgi:putative membrane protein